MNGPSVKTMKLAGGLPALGVAALLTLVLAFAALAARATPGVLPPNSKPYGKSYGQWSAAWWRWALELPVEAPAPPHPFIDDPGFECDEGQSGPVWFLAGVFGTVERDCTVPAGKMVFFPLADVECADFVGEGSEADERDCADFFADHIVTGSLFCTIDGVNVQNLSSYRVASPQFAFTAPTPWIFGATGGSGTAVSDGYFLMHVPFSVGTHTIHFGGSADFGSIDTTYHLTVQ